MNIKNLAEANKVLLSYANKDPKIGKNFTLERVLPLMKAAGSPQDRLKVVHIAGTSGKTSTAYFMAGLLKTAGSKVGTTVSPHIDSVTERIQVNGAPLSEEVFCRELSDFIEIVEHAGQHPSYFELLYAFSLWVFDRQNVDYAVLETGVGGRYDATNVTSRPDKVCIITDIGFDHTHLLGNTLAKIASQKIGIVHAHNVVFMYEQPQEVMDVVYEATKECQATVNIITEQTQPDAESIPDYQKRNWQLAYRAYQYLEKRDDLPRLTRQALRQTKHITVPGRMDTRQIKGKTVIMDGAHNQQKMVAFIESFRKLYPGIKPAVMVSLKHNKDHEDIAPLLVPFANRVIVTAFSTTQDSTIKSMDSEVLGAALREAGAKNLQIIPDQHAALEALLDAPERVCVITGSFYLLSRVRNDKLLV